ncbi:amino acid ABC transporter permease [Myxosarcina sp. GI1]|uniref:amino acid ABC transporter permease n=1 Tax=Myxosarcina sp. GI1 TaxID=1541065 RepID=UPI0005645591|nr:amino acid ABC transporter permease [Myxosarcina sp. GI1]
MSVTNIAPPKTRVSPKQWLQKNLFNTWYNSILTIISLLLIYWLVSRLFTWAFTQAQWQVIAANWRLFFVGRYPVKALWRAWTTLVIIFALTGLSWGILARAAANLFDRHILVILSVVAAICILVAIPGGIKASALLLGMLLLLIVCAIVGQKLGRKFPNISSWLTLIWSLTFFFNLWLLLDVSSFNLDRLSGLMLTIPIAVISIVLCFPFGVLLALGRQSKLPVIHWLSVAYIEIVRGFPLIGILFMAQVMLPLVLPAGVRPERVVRAIAGFTIYSAAYLAENVRGGLQSIPRGQTEAAQALGLNPIYTLAFIILPQALKAVIPSMVGQFIALFKDTSLLAIVGLTDLLGISQSILANPKYLGRYGEVYIFVAAIYWVFCYSMSAASRRLEK